MRDGQRDELTDKKQTFYWTTTLQADPINPVDYDVFWRDCCQIAFSLFPAPLTFMSFWVLVLNPRSHMYMYMFLSWFYPKVNGSLAIMSLKTWDGLHTDGQIHKRPTYRQTGRHKQVKI